MKAARKIRNAQRSPIVSSAAPGLPWLATVHNAIVAEHYPFRRHKEDFLLFLREDGNDPVANYNAALCLLTTDRRDLAVRYMERTVQAAPESDEARKARRFLGGEPGAAGRER